MNRRQSIPYRALSAAAVAATIAGLGLAGTANANTYQVTNTKDYGDGSFRKAIHITNKEQGRDKITFDRKLSGEIDVRKEEKITDPLRITGNGVSDNLKLSGTLSGSRLEFTTNRRIRSRIEKLDMVRVSLTASGPGGDRGGLQAFDLRLDGDNTSNYTGIYANRSPLNIDGTKVVSFLGDGIIADHAGASISETTVDGNGGNGIYADNDDVVVERTTVSNNRGYGVVSRGGVVGLTNSTISGNGDPTDAGTGALYAEYGSFKVESSTIADNTFLAAAGGAAMTGVGNGTITLENNVIADNHGGHNCSANGKFLSEGGNVFDDASNCDGLAGGDVLGDPLLGPLSDNGGPTLTQALGAGSPAIGNAKGTTPATDQRGIQRDGDPDSGSFEFAGG